MNRRVPLGLAVRAVVTAGIQAGVLACVVMIQAVIGALLGFALGVFSVEVANAAGVTDGLDEYALVLPLMVVFAGLLMYDSLQNVRTMLRDGRERLLAAVEPAALHDGRVDAESGGGLLSDSSIGERPDGRSVTAGPLSEELRRGFVETTRRLVSQATVPSPTPCVHPAAAPLCYTVHHDGEVFLVVSRGLVRTLSTGELEAVLAHEIAHLANGDHRVMTWAVVPLIVTEELHDSLEDDEAWALLARSTILLSRIGTALFSRGRELTADRAAGRLTGDPGTLASALERLDDALADRPPEDLRDHVHTVDALNVVPALDPDRDGSGGLLATHPGTETRIERLRELEREQETA